MERQHVVRIYPDDSDWLVVWCASGPAGDARARNVADAVREYLKMMKESDERFEPNIRFEHGKYVKTWLANDGEDVEPYDKHAW